MARLCSAFGALGITVCAASAGAQTTFNPPAAFLSACTQDGFTFAFSMRAERARIGKELYREASGLIEHAIQSHKAVDLFHDASIREESKRGLLKLAYQKYGLPVMVQYEGVYSLCTPLIQQEIRYNYRQNALNVPYYIIAREQERLAAAHTVRADGISP